MRHSPFGKLLGLSLAAVILLSAASPTPATQAPPRIPEFWPERTPTRGGGAFPQIIKPGDIARFLKDRGLPRIPPQESDSGFLYNQAVVVDPTSPTATRSYAEFLYWQAEVVRRSTSRLTIEIRAHHYTLGNHAGPPLSEWIGVVRMSVPRERRPAPTGPGRGRIVPPVDPHAPRISGRLVITPPVVFWNPQLHGMPPGWGMPPGSAGPPGWGMPPGAAVPTGAPPPGAPADGPVQLVGVLPDPDEAAAARRGPLPDFHWLDGCDDAECPCKERRAVDGIVAAPPARAAARVIERDGRFLTVELLDDADVRLRTAAWLETPTHGPRTGEDPGLHRLGIVHTLNRAQRRATVSVDYEPLAAGDLAPDALILLTATPPRTAGER